MKLQETDIVKRKYDIENNTNLEWEITRIYEDREGNTIIDIQDTKDELHEETCYPEQLVLSRYF